MAINFNIDPVNHESGSQLAADQLNTEVNNVLKFYKAMINSFSSIYTSSTVNITDNISQSDLNSVISSVISSINIVAGNELNKDGSTLNHNSFFNNNVTVGPSGNYTGSSAYESNIKIPNITINKYGHITSAVDRTLNIPTPKILAESIADVEVVINAADWYTLTCSHGDWSNIYLFELTLSVYGNDNKWHTDSFIMSGKSLYISDTSNYLQFPITPTASTTSDWVYIYAAGYYMNIYCSRALGSSSNKCKISLTRYKVNNS